MRRATAVPVHARGATWVRSESSPRDRRQEVTMTSSPMTERVQVVVIGAGQAGLSVGYCLARRGLSFVMLEANPRVGDSWRNRWDSLRLFTPAKYDGLIGLPFPAPAFS